MNLITSELRLEIPLLPPSVNHYKFGHAARRPEAKAYVDAVCIFAKQIRGELAPGRFYELEIRYLVARDRFLRVDENNFDKVSIDALKYAGLITDDRYIVDRVNSKRPCEDRRDERTIYKIRRSNFEL